MLGSVEDMAIDMENRAFRNLQKDQGDIEVTFIPADSGYAKQIPSAIYQLLDRMYRMACIEHNRLMNRQELKRNRDGHRGNGGTLSTKTPAQRSQPGAKRSDHSD
jgi:hypothetical protein